MKTIWTIVNLWLLLVTIFQDSAKSTAVIENGVAEKPEVKCGVEGIVVDVITLHPFSGRLYVQGESDDPNCVISHYGQKQLNYDTEEESPNNDQQMHFSLQFGECNMRRQRTLNPRGVVYTFTLIVSFHPIFETEVDRAYRIRCFFSESVKALEATFGVSQLTTQTIEQEFVLPTCSYEIRESPEGPFVKFARVGDHVWHVWHCDLEASLIYGMLIHSCHVDDGQGNQVPVIDNKGCVIDPLLLSNIDYDERAITAYAETKVFKYSDKVQLYFTCTVQLCVKSDGGCEDVTPPVCEDNDFAVRSPTASDNSQLDDPTHFQHGFESEKQLFGSIDILREEISKNMHFAPISSPKLSPTLTPELGLLRNEKEKRKSRPKRLINVTHHLALSETEARKVAETDLTTRIVVLPIFDSQHSSELPNNRKISQRTWKFRANNVCLPLVAVLIFIGTVTFLFAAGYFFVVVFSRREKSQLKLFPAINKLDKKVVDQTELSWQA